MELQESLLYSATLLETELEISKSNSSIYPLEVLTFALLISSLPGNTSTKHLVTTATWLYYPSIGKQY